MCSPNSLLESVNFLSLTIKVTTVPSDSKTKSGRDSTLLAYCSLERVSLSNSNTISGLGIVISFSGVIIIEGSA